MAWTNDDVTTISREAAITRIKELAAQKGYKAGFKVVYDGREIEAPSQLPEQIDMNKVTVASKLNNA